ncbi:MAG: hypothetical protein JO297_15665 [Nitrososphaeraceae archaeon]|nr:hypothetical protein [Nitrososphaeraceae archaeon]
MPTAMDIQDSEAQPQDYMIRFKRPIEYELSPDTIEKGTHWLSVHLKNTGNDHLKNLNIKMHSLDSIHISFRNPNHYIYD